MEEKETEKIDVPKEEITETKKKKEKSSKKETLTDKMRENPWIVSTLVLGAISLIILMSNFSGGITGNVISEVDAGQAILDFVKTQTDGEGEVFEINSLDDYFYEVVILYEGDKIPLYVTKDGENLIQGIVPLSTLMQQSSQEETPQTLDYSEEDLEKLKTFSSCLAEKGLVIYGANWCGYTTRLVIDTLGGFDIAGDAYIECTEETELCTEKGITGYPTIKINGESYEGERTLEDLGEETGCVVPELEGTGAVASSSDESCS